MKEIIALSLLLTLCLAQTVYSQTARGYFTSGIRKQSKSDYEGAIQDFTKAIELNPNYAKAYGNRGNAKQTLGDFKGAIEDYNKVLELKPNDALAYVNRGKAKWQLRDFKGSVEDYNWAIKVNPKYADAYYARANAKQHLGDARGAIEDYNKVLELNPNHPYAHYNRGSLKQHLGDDRGAIEDFNKALEVNPNHPYAYGARKSSKRNLVYIIDRESDEAIIWIIMLLSTIGVSAFIHYKAGNYLVGAGVSFITGFTLLGLSDMVLFYMYGEGNVFLFILGLPWVLIWSNLAGLPFVISRSGKCPYCKSRGLVFDIRSNSTRCRDCGFSPKIK
jgi:tetratricopeptide (TPR) repeat protein